MKKDQAEKIGIEKKNFLIFEIVNLLCDFTERAYVEEELKITSAFRAANAARHCNYTPTVHHWACELISAVDAINEERDYSDDRLNEIIAKACLIVCNYKNDAKLD